jgi:hypothetical protein
MNLPELDDQATGQIVRELAEATRELAQNSRQRAVKEASRSRELLTVARELCAEGSLAGNPPFPPEPLRPVGARLLPEAVPHQSSLLSRPGTHE